MAVWERIFRRETNCYLVFNLTSCGSKRGICIELHLYPIRWSRVPSSMNRLYSLFLLLVYQAMSISYNDTLSPDSLSKHCLTM